MSETSEQAHGFEGIDGSATCKPTPAHLNLCGRGSTRKRAVRRNIRRSKAGRLADLVNRFAVADHPVPVYSVVSHLDKRCGVRCRGEINTDKLRLKATARFSMSRCARESAREGSYGCLTLPLWLMCK